MNPKKLSRGQKQTRRRILEVSFKRRLSHLGSCLSAVDLIDAVYQVKKKNEKFVLSNGHAGLALYVILEKHGFLKDSHLRRLHVHPDRNPRLGIDVSTGSLGQGFPIALGIALADRNRNVYCVISDGECTEGSIWEALRIAAEQNLTNLRVILNANGWGAYSPISLVPLKRRIKAFGWRVIVVDGHDLKKIQKALRVRPKGTPVILFASTTVEQFPFLKGQDAHYYIMSKNDFEPAMRELK